MKIDGDSVVLSSSEVSNPTAVRFAWHKLAEPNLTGGTGLPVGAFRAGEVPEFFNTLPTSKEYRLVYDLDLSNLSRDIEYDVDNSDSIKAFDRIGYLLELDGASASPQAVFVSMNAFTDDVSKIGIPTAKSKAHFQQSVEAMDVYSNVQGITTGTDIATGNIEFWPNNYGPQNSGGVRSASSGVYDFGDQPAVPVEGYGCMQVHNHGAGQTVFAVNHWGNGAGADLGIGNSSGETRDWTFSSNSGSYSTKRLRVFVRPTDG